MTTIRSLVAATDFSPGSDAAVARAVQLAREHDAALHLLHAFDVSAWHSLKGVFDAQRLTFDPPPDVRVRQRLIDLAASLVAQTGLMVEAHFSLGAAPGAIDAYVRANAISLAVVGSRAEPSLSGLGSTASKVVAAPACPVLIVRSAEARPYDKVLAAIDLREGSMRAASFAIALLPAAHHHLLYVMDPDLNRVLKVGGVRDDQARLLRDSMRDLANRELQQWTQGMAAQATHALIAEVVDDAPSRAIVVRAAALPADCVVVGHHGLGLNEERFLGNMAQHVIHHTTRDVLVVR